MESRSDLIYRDLSCDELTQKVLKHHNYDGLRANQELRQLAWLYNIRQRNAVLHPLVGISMTGISAYNLSRMGVLSNSGKVGAVAGFCVGSLVLLSAVMPSSQAPVEESSPAQQDS